MVDTVNCPGCHLPVDIARPPDIASEVVRGQNDDGRPAITIDVPKPAVFAEQPPAGLDSLRLTADEPDEEQPALRGDATPRLMEDLSADRVEHHVGTPAVGDVADHRREVLGAVVDGEGGSELAAERSPVRRPGGGDAPRAAQHSERDRSRSRAPGARVR